MTQPRPTDPIRWETKISKGIGDFPGELAASLQALLPQTRGYSRTVFIALTSVYVSKSCPDEARRLLLNWVNEAELDPSKQHPDDLALRFATAIIENQPSEA